MRTKVPLAFLEKESLIESLIALISYQESFFEILKCLLQNSPQSQERERFE
jgi:hypothetical protein